MNSDSKKIEEVLTKGVEQVLPTKEGLASLMKKRKIRLYNGIDPTSKKLHLGHSIPLRKLQQFADLGHEVIVVFGTGTVLAGDPSLRDSLRPKITEKEIKENIKTWKKQASKILDFSKVKIKYNGDWLLKLGLKEILDIASNISAVKLFQRDMFQRRLNKGETVWLHETLYPLLQGYDSVAMDVDLEVGGTDQVFNMLIGRELMEKMKGKEKFVMTTPMILGTDGKQMSKSSGNCVWLDDTPEEMYGKIMSIPDELIISYFRNLTEVSQEDILEYENDLNKKKVNPSQLKRKLAGEIVGIYHGEEAASRADREFDRVFRQKQAPSEFPEVKISRKSMNIMELLIEAGMAPSKAEARRLVEQGGVKIDGKARRDWQETVDIKKGAVIQVGKRRFVKII
ncbi:MAG: tyrosine--tRNA ligase [Candidatus Paceibacterota bacterium]|jgi:tyrosyl-tRNA synthetase